jgi:predicted O-linked N-acetylglucosamine transferase (SPINDLY family)
LGVIAYQLGRHERAAELISQALSRNASNAPAHNNLGNVLGAQGKPDEAIACYRKALALAPDYVDAHFNLGAALGARGELDEAIACYQRILSLAPDTPMAHFNLGSVLVERGKLEEAIACYRKALALKPDFPEALSNLGNILREQRRLNEAIVCWQTALEIRPDFPEAHFNLGSALRDQNRLDEAAASYHAALALKPDFLEAHLRLGITFADQDRGDAAIDCFQAVLSLDPEHAEARWNIAMSQLTAVYESEADPGRCRAGFSSELTQLEHWFDAHRVTDGFKAVGALQPYYLAYQEENNRDLLKRYGRLCVRLMAEWFKRQNFARSTRRDSGGPIRVGVVSQYFHDQSVWNAIVRGWFGQLDRGHFSLHAFCLGDKEDQETAFAKSHATGFERGKRELRRWVEAILDAQPDVLLYPEIGMDPMTLSLASLRLAPVQAATWGHPETTGLPTIDYYLSAEDLEPANAQGNYTEQLITLPRLGCFYQHPHVDAACPDLDGFGIDSESPLLLCPGVPFKYAPQYDSVLIEIARRLGRCRFVFFTNRLGGLSEKLRRRLGTAFGRYQMDLDDFVTFIPWQNRRGFYGLLERAEVFLDTIGFSGFNTAMQAVECGLPIVTREGRFLRGRLASGILKRMGLPELVAQSEEDYVTLAVKLARDTEYREHIRSRIAASRHLLFEDVAPIRALEAFLVEATSRS